MAPDNPRTASASSASLAPSPLDWFLRTFRRAEDEPSRELFGASRSPPPGWGRPNVRYAGHPFGLTKVPRMADCAGRHATTQSPQTFPLASSCRPTSGASRGRETPPMRSLSTAFEGDKDVRVLVVDDHPAFRKALTSALRLVGDIEVAGEAGGGVAACEEAPGAQARRRADGPVHARPLRHRRHEEDPRDAAGPAGRDPDRARGRGRRAGGPRGRRLGLPGERRPACRTSSSSCTRPRSAAERSAASSFSILRADARQSSTSRPRIISGCWSSMWLKSHDGIDERLERRGGLHRGRPGLPSMSAISPK